MICETDMEEAASMPECHENQNLDPKTYLFESESQVLKKISGTFSCVNTSRN